MATTPVMRQIIAMARADALDPSLRSDQPVRPNLLHRAIFVTGKGRPTEVDTRPTANDPPSLQALPQEP